jgi:multiple sugar transport system ATP-binding protein
MKPDGQPFLEVENVSKQFAKHAVLRHASLSVNDNEILMLVGKSGCGKSTLLNIAAGLIAPDHGTVRIQGVDQRNVLPHRRDLACVFQHGNGYDHLTALQNLQLAVDHRAIPKSDRKRLLDTWIERLRLTELLPQKLAQLSGGQRQKVSIARAYLSGKRMLLMDEPLAHLDQIQRAELRDLIASLQLKEARTIVYVTHDSDEAMLLGDRIAVLENGAVQRIGTACEVHDQPRSVIAGNLIGNPPMQWLRLASRLVDGLPGAMGSGLTLYGVRPYDWVLTGVERSESTATEETCRVVDRGSRIELISNALDSKRLGDRWMLAVRHPNQNDQSLHIQMLRDLSSEWVQLLDGIRSCGWRLRVVATIEKSRLVQVDQFEPAGSGS